MKIGRYDLGIGYLGNGETIYNRARKEHGDYEDIAHIERDGTLAIYKRNLPMKVVEWLRKEAADYAAQNPKWHYAQ